MRDWFKNAWVYPKRRLKGVEDLFQGSAEVVIEPVITEEDQLIYSSINQVPADPLPEETHELTATNELLKFQKPDIYRFYKNLRSGRLTGYSQVQQDLIGAMPVGIITKVLEKLIKDNDIEDPDLQVDDAQEGDAHNSTTDDDSSQGHVPDEGENQGVEEENNNNEDEIENPLLGAEDYHLNNG